MGKQQESVSAGHDKLVEFYSNKRYKGQHKDKIKEKILSDENVFNEVLKEIHKDRYSTLDFDDFKNKYTSVNGNPFPEKKKPTEDLLQDGQNISSTGSEDQLSDEEKLDKILSTPPLPGGDGLSLPTIASESTSTVDPMRFTPTAIQQQNQIAQQAEEEQTQIDKQREEYLKSVDTGDSRTISAIAGVNQGFYGLPADILETFAIGANKVGKLTETLGIEDRVPVDQQMTYEWAQKYRKWIEELSPTNPAYQDELLQKSSYAAGDLASLILPTNITTKSAKAINEASKVADATNLLKTSFKEARKLSASTPAVLGAIKNGVNEFKLAKEAGADDDTAFNSFLKNAAAGNVLESIPVAHYFKRLDTVTGGGVKQAIKNGVTQGVEEMTTEVAQQVFSNVDAANTYDATRNWYDGMTDSGGIGFGLGFLLGGMSTSLRKKQSETSSPDEKQDIQRAIEFVELKQKELNLREQELERKLIPQEQINPESEKTEFIPGDVVELSPQINEQATESTDTGTSDTGADTGTQQEVVVPEQQVSDSGTDSEAIDQEKSVTAPSPVEQKNSLLTRIGEYNKDAFTKDGKLKKETKALTETRQNLLKEAQQLGYTVKSEGGKISLLDADGKKLSKTAIKQDKSTFRNLDERTPEVKEFYSKLDQDGLLDVAGTVSTGKLDLGLSEKEFQKAKIDIASGVKSAPAEKLLNFVEEIQNTGQVPFSIGEGKFNQKVNIPLDEFINNKVTEQEVQDYLDSNPESTRLEEALMDYISDSGEIDFVRLRDDIDQNPEIFTNFVHDLSPEEFDTLKEITYGQAENRTFRGEEAESRSSASIDEDSEAGEQTQEETNRFRAGENETAIERYRDKSASKEETIKELSSLNLTHVGGLNMGSNQTKGTYISTESENRYASRGGEIFKATVSIDNPLRLNSINEFFEIQREIIEKNFPEAEGSIDNLSDSEFQQLSDLVTEEIRNAGYDSIYFPESESQEGELIVFDRDKVVLTPPAPPESGNKTESPEDSEKLKRSFPKQLDDDPQLAEEVKKGMSEEGRYYYRRTNKATNDQANDIINDVGLEKAIEALVDTKNEIPFPVRVALGENIIKQANQKVKEATTEGEKNKYVNLSIKAADFTSQFLTELGQGVQAASMYAKLSPEGVLKYMQREIKKSRDKKLEEAEPTLEKIKSVIEKLNQETIEEILELPKVRDLIIEKSDNVKGSARKKAVKQAIDFLDSLKIDTKGTLRADITFGLAPAIWNGAISTIQTSLQTGLTIADAVEKAIKYIKKNHSGEWDEDGFKNKFDVDLKKYEASIDPEKAVKRGLKAIDVKIKDVIRKHYSEIDNLKQTLVDKLISETDISAEDAREVAKSIQDAFDKITSKAKQAELDRLRGIKEKTVQKRQTDQLYEKIIKASNLGMLNDQQLQEMYAEQMKLPQLTEEQAAKLMDLAEKAQIAKEGFQQRRAIEELLKYQESIPGINWMDVGTSIWYANILSGFSTQEINFFANLTEAMGELYTAAVYNPKNIPFLMKGLYEGYGRGLFEAIDTLKTGYSPIKSKKVDSPNILERVRFKGGNWNPFNYYKYVKRLMDASDIFAFHGLRELRAYELAATMARKEGKDVPTKDIWKRVNEKLYKTSERKTEAEAIAKQEGLKGLDYKRRVSELMDQSRPAEMVEDIDNAAARGTFNYDPEGTIGFLGDQIAALVEKAEVKGFKPLKFVVPFTRIVSNVANRYMDWSLIGFYRAGLFGLRTPGMGTLVPKDSRYKRKFTREEMVKEYIKASTGTLAMLTLYMLSQKWSDDEESFMEITAEGTGDFRDNYELAKNGWQKYSVRIGDKWYSYMNTPLAIPMSIMGHMRDDEKYKGQSLDKKDAATKFALAVHNNFQFITDMTFLKGLGDFMESFSNENPNAAINYFEKLGKTTVKGFVVPNLYTQSAKELQRIYGVPMKEANGLYDALIRDIPVANSINNDMIDALGDPIIADTDRLTSDVESDAAWNVIIKNKAWIGRVNKHSITIYDPSINQERPVTDDEYYELSKIRGKYIKKKILKNIDKLEGMESGKVKDKINEYKKSATKKAKSELIKRLR